MNRRDEDETRTLEQFRLEIVDGEKSGARKKESGRQLGFLRSISFRSEMKSFLAFLFPCPCSTSISCSVRITYYYGALFDGSPARLVMYLSEGIKRGEKERARDDPLSFIDPS